uniref:Uncharacterized protein n=1 Tax=Meloidogyne incognita TaxID=6306 RepID=A0A914L2P7_MELIC
MARSYLFIIKTNTGCGNQKIIVKKACFDYNIATEVAYLFLKISVYYLSKEAGNICPSGAASINV